MEVREISRKQGVAATASEYRIRVYAKHIGVESPFPTPETRSARPQKAYEMGFVQGIPWAEVARELKYVSKKTARPSALSYALRNSLPLPEYPQSRGRQEEAYNMRTQGAPYAVIAETVGYSSPASAWVSVREYCDREGVAFPRP